MRKLSAVLIALTLSISFALSCSKPNDKNDFEEIVATMSMKKAKLFFDNHPESQYRDKLANEIIGWCKREETEICYKMLVDVLPKKHPRYKEVIDYYGSHYEDKRIK